MNPKIVSAETDTARGPNAYTGWDADGTEYHIKAWDGMANYFNIHPTGPLAYWTTLGQISFDDLFAALDVCEAARQ